MQADRNAEVKSRETLASTNAQMNAVHIALRSSHEQLERDRDTLTQNVSMAFNQHVAHLLLHLLREAQSNRGTVSATAVGLAFQANNHIGCVSGYSIRQCQQHRTVPFHIEVHS